MIIIVYWFYYIILLISLLLFNPYLLCCCYLPTNIGLRSKRHKFWLRHRGNSAMILTLLICNLFAPPVITKAIDFEWPLLVCLVCSKFKVVWSSYSLKRAFTNKTVVGSKMYLFSNIPGQSCFYLPIVSRLMTVTPNPSLGLRSYAYA